MCKIRRAARRGRARGPRGAQGASRPPAGRPRLPLRGQDVWPAGPRQSGPPSRRARVDRTPPRSPASGFQAPPPSFSCGGAADLPVTTPSGPLLLHIFLDGLHSLVTKPKLRQKPAAYGKNTGFSLRRAGIDYQSRHGAALVALFSQMENGTSNSFDVTVRSKL